MALVSISYAAKYAGMSRTQLYRGYLKKGKISTVTDGDKTPKIDTSELLIAASILMVQVYMASHEQDFTSIIVRIRHLESRRLLAPFHLVTFLIRGQVGLHLAFSD